jgi:CHAD domain-containing protein
MAKPTRVSWNDAANAAENTRLKLPVLALAYFRAGRKLAAGVYSAKAYHQFRLKTKRLRYTLEFFRPCYGPGLAMRLAALRKLQDCLGDISDCEAARDLVKTAPPEERKQAERHLRARIRRRAAQFRRDWQREFDAAGEERRWRAYLSRSHAAG